MNCATGKPLTVTAFRNYAATSKTEAQTTVETLMERIRLTSAGRKDQLPWLKLARFGDLRTVKGSLRHDANVIAITGIEGDYDGGQFTFDEAVELLTKQGVFGIVYTSPSHTDAAPRWRALCPLSEQMPPGRRDAYMGRLNGLFRGIFAGESWTLSQAYYYGSVNRNPAHRVEVIEGHPIDAHDDLDTIWRGKTAANGRTNGAREPAASANCVTEDAELIRRILTGEGFHVELTALAARYVGRNIPPGTVVEMLRGLMWSHAESARDERWWDRYRSLDAIVESAQTKFRPEISNDERALRRKLARLALQRLRDGTPGADVVAEMAQVNRCRPEPLSAPALAEIGRWALRKLTEEARHVG